MHRRSPGLVRCLRWGLLTGTHISSIDRYSKPRRGSSGAFFSAIMRPAIARHFVTTVYQSGDRQLIGPAVGIAPKYRHVMAMDFVALRSCWIHEYGIKRD